MNNDRQDKTALQLPHEQRSMISSPYLAFVHSIIIIIIHSSSWWSSVPQSRSTTSVDGRARGRPRTVLVHASRPRRQQRNRRGRGHQPEVLRSSSSWWLLPPFFFSSIVFFATCCGTDALGVAAVWRPPPLPPPNGSSSRRITTTTRLIRRYCDSSSSSFSSASSSSSRITTIEQFTGPEIGSGAAADDNTAVVELRYSVELAELGLVLSVGPSTVATGSWGLFCRLGDGVEETTLPALTLLAGYAKPGTFRLVDEGDKTVGFTISSKDAPVFFNRQLMTIEQALATVVVVASGSTDGSTSNDDGPGRKTADDEVRLAGHDVYYDDEQHTMVVVPTSSTSSQNEAAPFARYFVPNCPNDNDNDDDLDYDYETNELNIANLGQYCNDRAFVTGMTPGEYARRCETENCVHLVWRLEYDEHAKLLRPSWPVSVLARDLKFTNRVPMELGTTYGWNYWNASVVLNRL